MLSLPFNGCCCSNEDGQQKKGCTSTRKWLQLAYNDENYFFLSSYKLYQGFLQQAQAENSNTQLELDIKMDLERTFQQIDYFKQEEIKASLLRILMAFAHYETSVGYVQGMNFIAAVLHYHAGEVAAFWLLCALMDKHGLNKVLSHGLVGLQSHEQEIEKLGLERLPKLFEHFDNQFVSVNLFSTDWIISMFLNFIPIEHSHVYLDLFFAHGWSVFYEVAILLLQHYEKDVLRMRDAGQIVGQIKQARLGCEHLLILSSQPSIQSSRRNMSVKGQSALRSSADFNIRKSEMSGIPFAVINPQKEEEHPENFKDSSLLEDSDSEPYKSRMVGRSMSMLPAHQQQRKAADEDQVNKSYLHNPLYIKNLQMWSQIIAKLEEQYRTNA